MVRRGFCRAVPLLAACFLLGTGLQGQEQHRGRKYKAPPPTCKISVTVVREDNGKPIEGAAVVFHPIAHGKDQGNMELKTNEDGKAVLDMIPIGDTVRLQVIASGFQTFGADYDLPSDTRDIPVKLHLPVRQYSIYESHPDQSGSNPQGSGQASGNSSGNKQGSQNTQNPQDGEKPPQ
jgi:hypothetical protein